MTSPAENLKYPAKRVFEEAEKRDLKLTKTAFNKILYIVKQELSEDNTYYNDILCFWYLHGTLAQGSHQTLVGLKRGNYIRQNEGMYWNNPSESANSMSQEAEEDDEEELSQAINYALNEYDVYSEDRIRKLYERYAPYEFMVTFRHDFLDKIEELSEEGDGGFLPLGDELSEEREELRDLLLKAESELPIDEEFREFNDVFSRFVGDSNYFLDNEPSREEFNFYLTVSKKVWALFACKIRLVEHDEQIDVESQGWKEDYQDQLKETRTTLEDFEDSIRQYDSEDAADSSDLWSRIAQKAR
jgi:hypothetical protein